VASGMGRGSEMAVLLDVVGLTAGNGSVMGEQA
jgi:hypothetical protein